MKKVTYSAIANRRAYWENAGDSSIAPESARKPIAAEVIAEAEAELEAIAARIRRRVTA